MCSHECEHGTFENVRHVGAVTSRVMLLKRVVNGRARGIGNRAADRRLN